MAKKKAAKMGRPVNPDGPAVVVAVSVPKGLADGLEATAKSHGLTKSAAVADALRAWLKRKKR